MARGRAGWRGRVRAAALVWLVVAGVAVGAEVRLTTCDADASLCPDVTGLIHPHAPADGTHDDFSGGVSVGDFNRDGWQDLFVVTGGEGPDRLYLNRGDGTFREAAERAGVAAVHRGHGSVVGDIDKDGWPDIFVTSFGPADGGPAMAGHHLLWLNLGSRRGGVLADGTPLFRNIALPAPGRHHLSRAAVRHGGGVRRLRPRRRPGPGSRCLAARCRRQRAAEQPGHRRVDRPAALPQCHPARAPVRHRHARLHPPYRRRRRRPLAGGAGGGRLRHQPAVPQQPRRHLHRRNVRGARGAGHQRHGQRARRPGQRRPARLVRHLDLDHLPVREPAQQRQLPVPQPGRRRLRPRPGDPRPAGARRLGLGRGGGRPGPRRPRGTGHHQRLRGQELRRAPGVAGRRHPRVPQPRRRRVPGRGAGGPASTTAARGAGWCASTTTTTATRTS